MSSPFRTPQEFADAEAGIYTFANQPTIVALLIVVSALMFLYFIYASFTIKKGASTTKSPIVLSILLATSTLAMADALYTNYVKGRPSESNSRQEVVSQNRTQRGLQPLALFGLVGVGKAASRQRSALKRKRQLRR